MSERQYTEEEVQALLARAAELQRARGAEQTHTRGLTLDELASAAADAGLDPALLHQAAAELEARGRVPLRTADAKRIYVERRLPGRLTRGAWDDAVALLESRLPIELKGILGDHTSHYRRNERTQRTSAWWHRNGTSEIETRFEAHEDDDEVVLRLHQRVGLLGPLGDSLLLGGGLALIVGFFSMVMLKNPGLGLLAALVTMLVMVPLVRAFDRAWRGKKHDELEALSEEVALLVGEAQPAPEAEPIREASAREASAPDAARLSEAPAAGTLDLDALDAAPEPAARRRTRRSR